MAGLASKVCGSVFGLLMIDEACTYLPPTWEMTSEYSFSAPIAVILVVDPVPAGAVAAVEPPPAPGDDDEDDQAPASSAAPRGSAATRRPVRVPMTLLLPLPTPTDAVT